MTLTKIQQKLLMGDLNPDRVSSRRQGSANLSYLEAWDVKATLIRVFGFGGFSAEASDARILKIEDRVPKTEGYGQNKTILPVEFDNDGHVKYGTANFRVTAMVHVKLTIFGLAPYGQDAVYSEYAVASQTGPDIGEVTDFAVKTAESDALKRAAIYLGTQFGLSLYDSGTTRDVIRVVAAPGQEWRNGESLRQDPYERPQEPAKAPPGPDPHPAPESGLTEEQRAENQALLDRALRARATLDRPVPPETHEEVAAQESTPGWPPMSADEM